MIDIVTKNQNLWPQSEIRNYIEMDKYRNCGVKDSEVEYLQNEIDNMYRILN